MSLETEYALYNAILKPIFKEDLELGRFYSSPIPSRGDSKPSFQVYAGINAEDNDTKVDFTKMLFWKDWGYGKHLGHRPVHLVRHLSEDAAGNMISEDDAWKCINTLDFPRDNINVKTQSKKVITHRSSLNLQKREITWWNPYYIPPPVLRTYKVAGTRKLWTDGVQTYDSKRDEIMFTYLGPGDEYQLYRPEPKWYSRNIGGHFLLGYEQLPYKGRILLILSGMKDGLCCFVTTGWPFVSACGENDYKSFLPWLPELRTRFDYIGICQDPDKAGRQANLLLQDKLDLPIFDFPYPNETDDIAKLMYKHGPAKLRAAFFNKTNFF